MHSQLYLVIQVNITLYIILFSDDYLNDWFIRNICDPEPPVCISDHPDKLEEFYELSYIDERSQVGKFLKTSQLCDCIQLGFYMIFIQTAHIKFTENVFENVTFLNNWRNFNTMFERDYFFYVLVIHQFTTMQVDYNNYYNTYTNS